MTKEIFLSDSELENYRKYAANQIFSCSEDLKTLDLWTTENRLEVPISCWTNFRDSWFHYRKLYEQRQHSIMYQELYALEEHLNRSLKDAILSFYQHLLVRIDYTYTLDRNTYNEIVQYYGDRIETILEEQSALTQKEDWVEILCKFLDDNFTNDYYFQIGTVVCLYIKNIVNQDVQLALQNNMHQIKNYLLKLRLDGTNIYRINPNEGGYLKECEKLYDQLINDLRLHKIKTLLLISNSFKKQANGKIPPWSKEFTNS